MISARFWHEHAQQWQYKHFNSVEDAEEYAVKNNIQLHNVKEIKHGSNRTEASKV